MSNNAHELSNRLLNALDNNYNVVDMHAVNEIISILEKINITKELLETTRLGKHVNELRRKTSDPTLARRAKVLVKRWRDLVIPAAASPQNTGSNRSSAERQTRRLGGTPITSPAFARQVVSPAVPSPRPPSRPAWGGYESDSQDVILVDDDPPPPPPPCAPAPAPAVPSPLTLSTPIVNTPPKRPLSPEAPHDEKKAKRDKKPKKRRGHSRAGSGTETPPALAPAPATVPAPGAAWAGRNGTHSDRKKNGVRNAMDPYAALVNRMPPAGAKKVKTTKELLAQIQSRGSRRAASPRSPRAASPADPASPDVMLIEPDEPCPVKVESPLRNGGSPAPASPAPAPAPSPPPLAPLEDEREVRECTCGEEQDDDCPAARRTEVLPVHVHALHHALLPGVNGTRAPLHPHQFAVRKLDDPERPELFASIVPLYNYSDYADDYCVKNLAAVPLCTHLPWTEFAPPPPELPPPREPPPPRPYPLADTAKAEPGDDVKAELDDEVKTEPDDEVKMEPVDELVVSPRVEDEAPEVKVEALVPVVAPEMVSAPPLEPSERLKAPIIETEDETLFRVKKCDSVKMDVADEFESEQQEHRTVERTKEVLDGRALYALCESTNRALPYTYGQAFVAPVVTLPEGEGEGAECALDAALAAAAGETQRDARGRPQRRAGFAEWHECAALGELVALPYVVID